MDPPLDPPPDPLIGPPGSGSVTGVGFTHAAHPGTHPGRSSWVLWVFNAVVCEVAVT